MSKSSNYERRLRKRRIRRYITIINLILSLAALGYIGYKYWNHALTEFSMWSWIGLAVYLIVPTAITFGIQDNHRRSSDDTSSATPLRTSELQTFLVIGILMLIAPFIVAYHEYIFDVLNWIFDKLFGLFGI